MSLPFRDLRLADNSDVRNRLGFRLDLVGDMKRRAVQDSMPFGDCGLLPTTIHPGRRGLKEGVDAGGAVWRRMDRPRESNAREFNARYGITFLLSSSDADTEFLAAYTSQDSPLNIVVRRRSWASHGRSLVRL